jgi:acyl carrier protein
LTDNASRSVVLERLSRILREVLNNPDLAIKEEYSARDVPGWDSLAHVNIVMATESEFKMRLRAAEMAKLQNVSGLIDVIMARGTV